MKIFTRILPVSVLVAIGLTIAVSNARADVIYNWVLATCVIGDCGPGTGTATFDDTVLSDGVLDNADVLGFDLTFGGFHFGLADVFSNPNNFSNGGLTPDKSRIDFWNASFIFPDTDTGFATFPLTVGANLLSLEEQTGPFGGNIVASATGEWVRQGATAIPEPTAIAIFALGLTGLGMIRRRRTA